MQWSTQAPRAPMSMHGAAVGRACSHVDNTHMRVSGARTSMARSRGHVEHPMDTNTGGRLVSRPRARGPRRDIAVAAAEAAAETAKSTVYELDFCSRPILDERGKKVWELLVTDSNGSFTHSKFFPNNKINSTELKNAMAELLASREERPEKVLFFRNQMQTIITRALTELEIEPVPSRRCYRLMTLLEDRLENVYKKDPNYSEKAATLFVYEMGAPEDLPDALRGESWSFVQLPLGALRAELEEVVKGNAFGSVLDLESVGLDVNDETLIPGVAIYSRRANPLAAWTNGLELAAVVADTERAFLVLETGVNDRWKYGAYRRTQETTEEAFAWETAKQEIGGLHFLTVMTDEDADDVAGLWLLCDKRPPNV